MIKSDMVMLRVCILSIMMFLCVSSFAQEPRKIVIVNGYFFNELPKVFKSGTTDKQVKFYFIVTPDNKKMLGISSPHIELSDETLSYSIPVEEVKDGEEIMRRYNEKVKNSYGISSTIAGAKPLINVGDRFPDFSATDIDGKNWTNADVKGMVMVINVWYTGCGPCRKEMPELSKWKDEMADVIFFSSTYESPDVAKPVLDKMGFNWIHLVNDNQFSKLIGQNGYPLTIIVDKSGKVAAFEYGTSHEQRDVLKRKIMEIR